MDPDCRPKFPVDLSSFPDEPIMPVDCRIELVPDTDPILFKTAEQVTDIAEQVKPYARDMIELMIKKRGVGLAAPQVGLGFRFFVSAIKGHQVVINPIIDSASSERSSKSEGCLTWPGRSRFKARAKEICVSWTDASGERKHTQLDGLAARIFQHECDHLDGICLFG